MSLKLFNNEIFLGVTLFCICLVIFTCLSMQGLDVTDTGYHLTNQYELINNISENFSESSKIILTNLIGGIWLHIFPKPFLLWAFIGGSIIFSLSAFFTYKINCIIFPEFNRIHLFILILFSSLFIGSLYHNGVSKYIHYFSLPAFILVIFFYFWVKIVFNQGNESYTCLYSAFLGCILSALVLSRINNVIFLCFVLFVIAAIYHKRTKTIINGLKFKYVVFGIIVSFSTFFLWLLLSGINFFNIDPMKGREYTHSIDNLLPLYLNDGFTIGVFFFCFLLLMVIFYFYYSKKRHLIVSLSAAVLIILSILYYLGFFSYNINDRLFIFVYSGLVISTFVFYVLFVFLKPFQKGYNKNLCTEHHLDYEKKICLTFFLLIIAMISGCLGSNVGLLKIPYGLLIPLPLALIIVLRFICAVDIKKNKLELESNKHIIYKTLIIIFSLIMCVNFIYLSNYHVFRDDSRINLTEPFTYHSLNNIYSTPERVEVLEEFLYELDKHDITNQKVLFFNSLPLLYYLTGSKPAFQENPWPDLRSEEQIMIWQNSIENSGELPKIFARAKCSMGTNWPKYKIETDSYTIMSEKMCDYYVNRLQYQKTWENEVFEIYKKPDI